MKKIILLLIVILVVTTGLGYCESNPPLNKDTQNLEDIDKKKANDDSFKKLIDGVVIGVVMTVMTGLLFPFIRWRVQRNRAFKIFLDSLDDAQRHCLVSLNVLFSIDFNKGDPSILDFKKLIIPKDAPFFNENIFKQIGHENTKGIQNLRAKSRNVNIEIEEIVDYFEKGILTEYQKIKYRDYLISKMEFIANVFRYTHEKITDEKCVFGEVISFENCKNIEGCPQKEEKNKRCNYDGKDFHKKNNDKENSNGTNVCSKVKSLGKWTFSENIKFWNLRKFYKNKNDRKVISCETCKKSFNCDFTKKLNGKEYNEAIKYRVEVIEVKRRMGEILKKECQKVKVHEERKVEREEAIKKYGKEFFKDDGTTTSMDEDTYQDIIETMCSPLKDLTEWNGNIDIAFKSVDQIQSEYRIDTRDTIIYSTKKNDNTIIKSWKIDLSALS